MKEALTIETVITNEMTWIDVMKYYDPEITENSANAILWEETCYPFDAELTLLQINKLLNHE